MRQLAGVQAVDRGVAPAVNGFTVCGGAKRVCCIVNQCEFVTSRDSLQGFMVTRLAVNVRGVIAASTRAGSSVSDVVSMSQKTGRAPAHVIACADAANENAVVTTSPQTFSARSVVVSAIVALAKSSGFSQPRLLPSWAAYS